MTRDLAVDLIAHHVPKFRAALEPLLLPSIRIRTQRLAYDGSKLASKFGGLPLMPPEMDWPTWDPRPWHRAQVRFFEQLKAKHPNPSEWHDKKLAESVAAANEAQPLPLAFLGQILLDELPDNPLPDLPRTGRLLFFYDLVTSPGSYDPASLGSGQVRYVPDTSRDVVVTAPEFGKYGSFPHTAAMRFEPEWTVPDHPAWEGIKLDRFESPFEELLKDLYGEPAPLHRIGGHAQPVQKDMRLKAQLVTHGIYCGDATGYKDPRRKALEPGAKDWQLLLQIDTDEDSIGWTWGDVGMFYVWIRRQDLAARKFDHVFCEMQCH
jgi:uncharacterized protein YwqG